MGPGEPCDLLFQQSVLLCWPKRVLCERDFKHTSTRRSSSLAHSDSTFVVTAVRRKQASVRRINGLAGFLA